MRDTSKLGAGKYNTRVTIQRIKSSLTVDAAGHIAEASAATWETYCQRWCAVAYGATAERIFGDGAQASGAAAYLFRYDTSTRNITPDMRIKHGDRVISVSGMPRNVNEANQEIAVLGVEVA